MTITEYIDILNKRFKTGISREHSYRTDLENLIRALVKDIHITNEPQNVTDCGNPDYVITRNNIPVGFIEAKDIGKDITSKHYKEQFDRYKKALDNLIITDYLHFQFFQNGELIHDIKLGEIEGDHIKPLPANFEKFANLINDFCTFVGQTIRSAKKLAEMMASKARLLQNILAAALEYDINAEIDSSLTGQYQAFKDILIHDLDATAFADIYAQTLAYGMFAARLHDTSLDDFSRQEAAELIPKSNPFLRKLFQYVAGYDIDERIRTTVDNLAEVFRATDIMAILKNFGKSTQTSDPIIHFYETFLSEYDPKLRKARGVWYTPEPVVNFIVRAVDDILKTEFNLKDGLADTSKTKIKVKTQTLDKRHTENYKTTEVDVHKVQILDPATGTGTFLAEVVKYIYSQKFEAMQGAWSNYVENDLIPRLNGFELLMASYAMAHLKLDLLLTETGYKPKKEQRFNIFLTNSLEEAHPDTNTLLAQWLSDESNAANRVKKDTPVMVVIGNPPYSKNSTNKGEWIEKLVADYKKNLNEKNIQALSDDYVKFIRFGQHYIDKNGSGILAYISNNSFIDGIVHRQMRKSLLGSFDKIYILDLHGSAKRKETAADGSTDQNVFDIMQGVSVNIFFKSGKKDTKNLGTVMHFGISGKREMKYQFLNTNSLSSISWNSFEPSSPEYFVVKKDLRLENENGHFKIEKLFSIYNSGLTTEFDELAIVDTTMDGELLIENLTSKSNTEIGRIYSLGSAKMNKIDNAIKDVKLHKPTVKTIYYRPFDMKFTVYTGITNGIMGRPRHSIMRHFFSENLGLVVGRQGQAVGSMAWNILSITNTIVDGNIFYRGRGTIFPLYLYPQGQIESQRIPNLDKDIIDKIAKVLNYTFIPDENIATDPVANTFTPVDVLDYIYAVLHSPTYREKYKEFLKIDFPRVPYPKNTATFKQLTSLGSQLRQIHLLESDIINKPITKYPIDGSNVVDKPTYRSEKVYINETQYFEGVPQIAWEFYMGGYQPAQKWLKDRKGRELHYDDIMHYQKIIVALMETDRLMKEIDEVDFM
jgi:predicted helicase